MKLPGKQNTTSQKSLANAPCGKRVRVCRLDGEPGMCNRLREMGFCEEAEVSVVRNNGPVICLVCGSKVGMSSQLAESIHVDDVA